jgi:nucleoid-associated protein YgaU
MFDINKTLKKINPRLDESVVSMVLGAIVVVLVAVMAYGYFKNRQPAANVVGTPAEQTTNENGELTNPTATVALPVSHTVVAGENLWVIAEKYYRSGYNLVDIVTANSIMNPDGLEIGQTLTIPNVYVRLPLTVDTSIQQSVTLSAITGTKYTVLSGDNLWQIAVRAYGDGYKWPEIAKANNLDNPDLIFAGNTLSIPR